MLVNIHYADDYGVFEAVRCNRWLAAGLPVLTEQGINDDEIPAEATLFTVSSITSAARAALAKSKRE